ncbi:MAG: serine hydrolase domain-containing protein [Bacteroidota bacterium]
MRYIMKLAVLLLMASCQSAQKTSTPHPFLVALDSATQGEGIPGYAMMVIQEGTIIMEAYKGQAEVSFAQPVTENTVFSINSIAKVYAGTAVMQLVDQGKIDVDDTLGTYLDTLPITWQGIHLRQLLNHTSGLPAIEDTDLGGVIGGKGEAHAWELVKKMPW